MKMMLLTLKRTFHPVGHGAFYTERFYRGNDCVFTAVYDCGSLTSSKKVNLKSLVNQEFSAKDKIDALFVSHFDADHVNGIKHLIDKCEKIYIPELTPCEKIFAFVSNGIASHNIDNDANKVIEKLYSKDYEDKVVEVEAYGDDNDVQEDFENTRENKPDKSIDISRTRGRIKSGISLRSSILNNWIYYPFHLKTSKLNTQKVKNFFAKAITANGIDFVEVKKIYERKDKTKDVKKFFTELFGKQINEYSMTVYSGYDNPCIPFYPCCCCVCADNSLLDCKDNCPYYDTHKCTNVNCLYMGDYLASHKNVNILIDFYGKYWMHSYTIQVPHHGSAKIEKGHIEAYGDVLYKYCKKAVISTEFGKHKGVPSIELFNKLIQKRVAPIFVTENPESKYKQVYNIY